MAFPPPSTASHLLVRFTRLSPENQIPAETPTRPDPTPNHRKPARTGGPCRPRRPPPPLERTRPPHLKLGSTAAVVASSIEVASEILRTQDTVFCSRPRLAAVTHFSYGGLDIGASPYGDRWRKLRRFGGLNMFNHGKVQSFRSIREQEVHLLVDSISKASSRAETTVNLSEMTVCLFNNITYREVFSKRATADVHCSWSPHHGLIMDMMTMMTDFNFGDFFPSFWWLDFLSGWQFKLHRRFREMDMIFEKEIQQRLLLKSAANHNNVNTTVDNQDEDFLDVVLRSQVEVDPSFGFLLSRKQAKALLMLTEGLAGERSTGGGEGDRSGGRAELEPPPRPFALLESVA